RNEDIIQAIFLGLTYSFSLASDLVTLALTAERFASLCYPQKMNNLPAKKGKIIRIFCAIAIIFISSMRLHYIGHSFESFGIMPITVIQIWDTVELAISSFADMILPFLLIFSMCIFSIKIVKVAIKRRNIKIRVQPVNPAQKSDDFSGHTGS